MGPKAVQAMNKLVNRDNIFLSLFRGSTPQIDAVLPMIWRKACRASPVRLARSMYSPFDNSNTASSRPSTTSSAPA